MESSPISEETLITDGEFKGELISELNQLRKEGILCDVTLRIEGQDFSAHRCVLSAASPYFRALFTNELAQNNSDLIELQEVKSAAANEALRFIYTGEARVNSTNALDLLSAADYWIIPRLKTKVAMFLNDTVNASNCLFLESVAAKFNCELLEQTAISCQIQNFSSVGKSDDFKELEYEKIKELTSRDDIIVSEEEEVYEAVVSWVKHDLAARAHVFPELLNCVRLFSMSKFTLREILTTEELVNKSETNRSILYEGLDFYLFPDRFQGTSLKPRDCLNTYETAVVVTGENVLINSEGCKVTCITNCFSLSKNCWMSLPLMPSSRSRHGAAVCCGHLFVVGGSSSKPMYSFNPKQSKWISHEEQFSRRPHCSVTSYNEELYVIGGEGQYWDSVDIYNPNLDEWQVLHAPMETRRAAHCAVTLGNRIFVIGGHDGKVCHKSVDCLDPLTDQWINNAADLISARRFAAAAACRGKIFVVGGYNDMAFKTIESSCEMYDPEVNQWSLVSSPIIPRAACGVISLDDHVYLFGGEIAGGSKLDSVERYDVQNDEWRQFSTMPEKLTCLQASVLQLSKKIFT